MSGPLQALVVSTFAQSFYDLINKLPTALADRIDIATNLKFRDFEGVYRYSEKTPNLAVAFRNPTGISTSKLIVEVGFDKTYENLVKDVRLWINGNSSVTAVILVKINESPKYLNTTQRLSNRELQLLDEAGVPNFTLSQEFGPIVYSGLVWVGSVADTFAEVWRRDPQTGLPAKVGDRIVSHY